MKTIEAGMRVKSGHYLNLRTWAIHSVAAAGEGLPGRMGDKYLAIPTFAARQATVTRSIGLRCTCRARISW